MNGGSRGIVVPAGHGRALSVPSGARVAVETVEPSQVGDFFAFVADDPREFLSAGHTRAWNGRLFPTVGEPFVSNRRRPLLTLIEDTSPGVHDMLVPACDPERYRQLGAPPGHRSCVQNLREACSEAAIELDEPPQPVNLFMAVTLTGQGALELGTSPARAGDRVVLQAEEPVVVVLSACPQDLVEISAGGLSDLVLSVQPG